MRWALVAAGLLGLIAAVAFYRQEAWALALWPWPVKRLSAIFLSSIFAAAAVPVIWIGLTGELRAMAGGALDFAIMYTGMAAFTLGLHRHDPSRLEMRCFGLITTALAILCLALFLWSRNLPFREPRPIPWPVRISFGLFAVILVLVGGALVLQAPNVFPWKLDGELSAMFGWIFLGAACYFLYGLGEMNWGAAVGQLLGFLAYDLVLIGPYIDHFRTVDHNLRINLIIYPVILIYSGLLALWSLFADPATRLIGGKPMMGRTLED
jgi:hypothetical protein